MLEIKVTPPPNIGSCLSSEQKEHLFDLADGLDSVCCFLKVFKAVDVRSFSDEKDLIIFSQDLQKSLDCLTSYMDALLFDLYEMCDY
jgi:hypothetical protein